MSTAVPTSDLTDQEIIDQTAQLIREWWDEELAHGDNPAASRATLERFVTMYFKGEIGVSGGIANSSALTRVVKMIEGVLDVDMALDRNRRGDIPDALGLVSRSNEEAVHHVIAKAVDHVRYYTGFPGRPIDKAAELVADAVVKAHVFGERSVDAIRKMYARSQ